MTRNRTRSVLAPARLPENFWWLFTAWWVIIAVIEAVHYFINPPRDLPPLTMGEALGTAVGQNVGWAVVGWFAVQTARRMAGAPIRLVQQAVLIAVVLVFSALVKNTLDFLTISWIPWLPDRGWIELLYRVPALSKTIALTFAAAYGAMYFLRYHERQLTASHLASKLAQAQLQALKMQINPHFLFNTLNSISALVRISPSAAERTIAQLSELLRASLRHSSDSEVTLQEELDFLRPYLEIERTRYGDRLDIQVHVPDDLLDTVVPHLMLQPLVENSIRHGIAPKPGPGRVSLSARLEGTRLRLEVTDDGLGLQETGRDSASGIGLANVRARLIHLYGDRHDFQLSSIRGRGLSIVIEIPLRRAPTDQFALAT